MVEWVEEVGGVCLLVVLRQTRRVLRPQNFVFSTSFFFCVQLRIQSWTRLKKNFVFWVVSGAQSEVFMSWLGPITFVSSFFGFRKSSTDSTLEPRAFYPNLVLHLGVLTTVVETIYPAIARGLSTVLAIYHRWRNLSLFSFQSSIPCWVTQRQSRVTILRACVRACVRT